VHTHHKETTDKKNRYRVLDQSGRHYRWTTAAGLTQLVRDGAAKTYGTRKCVHGVQLTCSRTEASGKSERSTTILTKPKAATGPGVYREHVAQSWYVFQHCGVRL